METDELASSFAAKKENEELKEKVAFLEGSIHKYRSYILLLRLVPFFWATTYKKSINKFCKEMGL